MIEVPMTHGKIALVDEQDSHVLTWKWYFMKNGYAVGKKKEGNISMTTHMHRLIMNPRENEHVDHINQDKLDNRRCNLRICTPSQNRFNVNKYKNNKSGYKGVFWHKRAGKWMAQVRLDGKSRYYGLFDLKEDAAKAYDEAARRLFGEFALTNFKLLPEGRYQPLEDEFPR